MSAELGASEFKIVAVLQRPTPTGVNLTKIAAQPVRVGEPVHTWRLEHLGERNYRLRIGGYSAIGVNGDKVTASTSAEQDLVWHLTWREGYEAHTIELASDRTKGWTVSHELSFHHHIVIEEIKPPFRHQLFRLDGVVG